MSDTTGNVPADSFLLDGDTALLVVKADPSEFGWDVALNRPCESCGGKRSVRTECGPECDNGVHEQGICQGSWSKPCPDCSGTGRHTFDIEAWLCDVYDCAKCIGGVHKRRDTFRVHVIDVLPIVRGACPTPTNAEHRPAHVHLSDSEQRYNPVDPDRSGICRENADLIWDSPWHAINAITLPPAAARGQWLVRLAVHQ